MSQSKLSEKDEKRALRSVPLQTPWIVPERSRALYFMLRSRELQSGARSQKLVQRALWNAPLQTPQEKGSGALIWLTILAIFWELEKITKNQESTLEIFVNGKYLISISFTPLNPNLSADSRD